MHIVSIFLGILILVKLDFNLESIDLVVINLAWNVYVYRYICVYMNILNSSKINL